MVFVLEPGTVQEGERDRRLLRHGLLELNRSVLPGAIREEAKSASFGEHPEEVETGTMANEYQLGDDPVVVHEAPITSEACLSNFRHGAHKPVEVSVGHSEVPRSSELREHVPSSWTSADRVTFIQLGTLWAMSLNGRWVSLHASGRHWIGDGVAGTVELLRRSLNPGGIMLVGEPYWRREPPDQATLEGCYGTGKEDWLPLPELIESFGLLGCDVVEMVLADQDSWDRYAAASWLNIRRWLDANPHHELADEMRAELASSPARYARYRREYLGWGVFALMNR